MSRIEPLPGFEDRAPSDRYCDLILTGGVTSSIAYPAAIFALATAYRFNSIGGSSSGAGAAALAAAAEYRRRHGSSDGFRIMLELTSAVADDVKGKTRLAWLFQPAKGNRRLFHALLPGFARPSGKLTALVSGVLFAYAKSWVVLAIGIIWLIAIVAAAQGDIDWSSAVLTGISVTALSLFAVVAAVILLFARDVGRIVWHDYGLCSGSRAEDATQLPLTDWLHSLIQEIAGRKADDPPLTFADLATAPGSPRETLNDPSPMGAQSINLQMITANVTHGRPYVFPQKGGDEGDAPPLYFRTSEMSRLFPADVVDYMATDPVTGRSNRYEGLAEPAEELPKANAAGWFSSLVMGTPPVVGNKEAMYRLPSNNLPILVAARMSVSFPVLFSAVPLWMLDKRDKDKPVFRRCLFCDGGICSAFPIHFFDSPIPSWPTFGISLHETPTSEQGLTGARSPAPKQEEREYGAVWLPQGHLEGREDQWNEFETEPKSFDRLSGFFNAIASTTKNWNDATLARLPGVRERVARVGLHSGIGGLNILMTGEEIRGLADLGRVAALKLLKRYAFPVAQPSDELSDGWNEHRWVRLNVLRDSLSNSLAGLTWAAKQGGHGKPLPDMIRHANNEPVLKGDERSKLLAAQAAALEGALNALVQAERALTTPTAEQPYMPSPRPVMRVRPPL